ncbi:MAG: enoyl-CoA hydratase/isomerase family protein, partial [Deltaproteobacteria bacterium]|nr:enoyl-CoA hydratase/isomerase family protein [Deltaproteobacteria bacterium]
MKLNDRHIESVGVIGSGQIGPDIALYFATSGISVVVVDVNAEALATGQTKLARKVDKQVERRRMKPEKAEAIKGRVRFTEDYDLLASTQLIIEAATEDLETKRAIFAKIEAICDANCVLTSNSSHLEPDALFGALNNPRRAAVTHFFYPADRNPVVEVVPGEQTDGALVDGLLALFELSGKLPIVVKPRYGYAIDPVFEGLCLAACQAVEHDLGTIKEVDAVAQKVLGLKVGPFTAMNLVGAAPILQVGIPHYHDAVMPWFSPSALLDDQLKRDTPWPIAARDETIEVSDEKQKEIGDWLLGAVFMLAGDVLDAKLIDISDYEDAIGLALDLKTPFALMNAQGITASLDLVERFSAKADGARVPATLRAQAEKNEPWPLSSVQRRDVDGVAVLTLRRFKVLNALSDAVLNDLERETNAVAADDTVKAVVVRGFGTRAFVAGADIRELARIETIEEGAAMARRGQSVVTKLENLNKPVIAAMNGLAFGGGNELSMACHARIAVKGQRVFCGQPEPKLGIIPGYGGTQRLPRIVGQGRAIEMIASGQMIGAEDAYRMGLVNKVCA